MTKRNENRPGYKKTRVGWIPEEWEWVRLKDISIINPESITDRTSPDYTFYYVDLGAVNEGKLIYPKEKIAFRQAPSRARRKVQKSDVLLATVRPNLKGFVYINSKVNDLICSTGYVVIRGKEGISSQYLYYNLFSYESGRYFYSCVVGSNYPALNNSDVDNLKIPLPPLPEQKKIAEILSAWDRVIEQVGKLIDAKQRLKKGLTQQLLTGKRRLPGFDTPFKTMKLGKIISPTQRPVSKPKQPYDAMGIRSHFKGTFAKHVEDPEKVAMDVLYIANSGDLIVNITFAWEGAIAIVPPEHDGRLVSHRFPTYIPNNTVVSIDYLRYLITQERFKYLLAGISPGGAGRNRVMSKKDFLKLEVVLPDVTEQKRVAKILDTASRELELLQAKAGALRKQKRGLMQQLLTGKKRVIA